MSEEDDSTSTLPSEDDEDEEEGLCVPLLSLKNEFALSGCDKNVRWV